jgi:hypothetical protein
MLRDAEGCEPGLFLNGVQDMSATRRLCRVLSSTAMMPGCYKVLPVAFIVVLASLSSAVAMAQTFSLSVDSRSNLYSAGHATVPTTPNGGGILPPYVVLTPGNGRTLTLTSVSGLVSYNDVDAPPLYIGQYNGPDGGAVTFQDTFFPNNYLTNSPPPPGLLPPSDADSPTTFYMDMDSVGGISGMKLYESDPLARRVMFLSGVFTTNACSPASGPSILDFSSDALTTSFTKLSPLMYQTFFIGDGLTGTQSGVTQEFIVPDGATHLYLGFLDGAYFVGGPDYYDNNRGSFSVQGMVAVPEPSSLMLTGIGAAVLMLAYRRRVPGSNDSQEPRGLLRPTD